MSVLFCVAYTGLEPAIRLVWPLVTDERMHKCVQAREVWGHVPSGNVLN